MIQAALILVRNKEALSPSAQLGGLSLLQRALLTVRQAGAKACYLLRQEGRRWSVTLVEEGKSPLGKVWEQEKGHVVVFSLDTLLHPYLLRHIQANPQEIWTLRKNEKELALALFPTSLLPRLLSSLQEGQSPLELDGRKDLWGYEVKTLALSDPFFYPLSSPQALKEAEKRLLASLENPRDGFTDTFLYRRLSRPLSRLVAKTSLHPNHITLLFLGLGLLAAPCFALKEPWGPALGSLLLILAVVLDNVDGEVARMKFLASEFGEWLDNTCGTVVYLAVFSGVAAGVWRAEGGEEVGLLGGSLVLGAFFSYPLITWAEKTQERGRWEDRVIGGMLKALTSHDVVLFLILPALLGRLQWFLWGAAIGAHLFWLTLAFLLARSGRLPRLKTLLRLLEPPPPSPPNTTTRAAPHPPTTPHRPHPSPRLHPGILPTPTPTSTSRSTEDQICSLTRRPKKDHNF